jgi:hypothetical protein
MPYKEASMFKLFDAVTAVGVSRAIKLSNVKDHNVEVFIRSLAATPISAVTVSLQGSTKGTDASTGLVDSSGLVIGALDATKLKVGSFNYRIANTNYSKTAAESTFTAAHVVSGSKYGVILVYINAAGTVTTAVPLATQAYTTAALAHAAADNYNTAIKSPATLLIGRILIAADAGGWTANTDDLTDGSDLTTATFLSESSSFVTFETHVFSSDELTACRATFVKVEYPVKHVRLYLPVLTGTGEVTARYTPRDGT